MYDQSVARLQPALGGNAQDCCHQWLIAKAAGPVSEGNCQICGDTKEFKNSFIANHWKPGHGKPFRKSSNDRPPLT